MMRPRLVHPTTVKIARLDRAATQWDPDFRTTGRPVYTQPVEVRAQVRYQQAAAFAMTAAGETPVTTGRLVMLAADYAASGGFAKGDKIVEIGGIATEAHIVEVRPAAFRADGSHGLVMLEFESRRRGP